MVVDILVLEFTATSTIVEFLWGPTVVLTSRGGCVTARLYE
jgi:hypothetical protein